MRHFLDWLKTRWRTRGEYAAVGRGLGSRIVFAGVRLIIPIGIVLGGMLGLGWILSEPSRSGARAMRVDALRDSIVAVVTRGGHGPLASLQEFVDAGILTADDVEFLADQDIVFHPIGRAAHDTAVVFRQTRGDTERRYRKNGKNDYYTAATSPDGRHSVVIGPGPPRTAPHPRPTRTITVRALESGRELGAMVVPEYAHARWSPDGRFLAIETRAEGRGPVTPLETFVLLVGPSGVRRLDLPRDVDPQALLAPEDRSARLQSESVRVLRWRGSTLDVESEGHGWIGPAGAAGSTSITVRCRFALEVTEGGVSERSREMVTYVKR